MIVCFVSLIISAADAIITKTAIKRRKNMATLMIGNVTAKGAKEQVLQMFNNLEDYYDKYLTSESGTEEKYTITFEFSSKTGQFFSYEYFQGYSEKYECEIEAVMECEEDDGEESMTLHYNRGEIIQGLSEYGIDADEF